MAISDTKSAQRFASIAEVAAAQAKEFYNEALKAPEYANEAKLYAMSAESSSLSAQQQAEIASAAAIESVSAAQTAAQDATAQINQQLTDQQIQFQNFLSSYGLQFIGDYEDGPYTFTARNQYIRYDETYWQVSASTNLPFSTTGNTASSWGNDLSSLTPISDDDALRSSLAESSGSSLIGTSSGENLQQALNTIESEKVSKEVLASSSGAVMVGYNVGLISSATRELSKKLDEHPSIIDFHTDSDIDYSTAMQRAVSAGYQEIYIPGVKEMGNTYTIGEIDITSSMLIHGAGGRNLDLDQSVIIMPNDAEYLFNFDSTGQSKRGVGGGVKNFMATGETGSAVGKFVIGKSWSQFEGENVGWNNSLNTVFELSDFMESNILRMNYRRVGTPDGAVIDILDSIGSQLNNVNNIHIENSTFGLCNGSWLRVSDAANCDGLWFRGNKNEYDATPVSGNTQNSYVLDLGMIARCWIEDNLFTHFKLANNKYIGIMRMRASALAAVTFAGNKAISCEGYYWNVMGGSLIAYKNESNQGDAASEITQIVTSNRWQLIDRAVKYTSNGNRTATPAPLPANYVSIHEMYGTVNNPFVTDSGASRSTVMSTPAGVEVRRFMIPPSIVASGLMVELSVRMKSSDSSVDGSLRLVVDGVTISSKTVTAASGWQLVTWKLKRNQIPTGLCILTNVGTPALLTDGYSCVPVKTAEWSFAWVPGAIAANSRATSPLQGYADIVGDAGLVTTATATANALIPGLKLQAGINAAGSVSVECFNDTSAAITPAFTRINIKVSM